MIENEDALAVLKRIERHQLQALEMQAEQLALVKAQMERTDAKVQESIGLQRVANSRQARVINVALPILFAALLYVGYLLFKHS